MSGLTGWIAFDQNAAGDAARLDRMVSRLQAPSRSDKHDKRSIAVASYSLAVVGPATALHFHTEAGAAAVVFGEPYLSDTGSGAHEKSDVAKRLVEGFRRRGPAILESLHGRFAAVVVLEPEHQALLAVDRVAVHPLGYSVIPGGLVFGSNADAIITHREVGHEIDPQQIFNYLYLHVVPSPYSIYSGHVRLEPGSYVWLREGRAERGRYWQPIYTREHETINVTALAQEFRNLLQTSVARQLNGSRVGAFLSGGTDSSTVAGLLGEVSGEPARTYSIGFKAQGYDEMAYARIAANHFGTRHHEYYVTPEDVARAIPDIARIHSEPFGNSSAVPTYYCARLAHDDGVDRLLAGDGGDELFGGNVRYATQHLLSLYELLPHWLRRGLIEPITFGFPAGGHIAPVRKMRSYISRATMPMPARFESWNVLDRLGIENVLHPDFLSQVDPAAPLRHLAEVYHGARAETLLNRMLALDHKLTLADNDLPKVSRSADLAGVEVAYPLLTDELMAFAERLPVRLKLKGTRLRYFFKEALRDFLPPEIIAKSKHGFGLPYGHWLLDSRPLREVSFESLSALKARQIIRGDFIIRLMDRDLPEHPGFLGPLAWALVMLEQWYRHHATLTDDAR